MVLHKCFWIRVEEYELGEASCPWGFFYWRKHLHSESSSTLRHVQHGCSSDCTIEISFIETLSVNCLVCHNERVVQLRRFAAIRAFCKTFQIKKKHLNNRDPGRGICVGHTVYSIRPSLETKHMLEKLTYLLNIDWFPGKINLLRLYNILKSFQCVTQALSQAI